ncbi:MAG: bifunctional PIG-L family deacetylase/class I SAM-dependent methyltransferase [Knoellia sp.]
MTRSESSLDHPDGELRWVRDRRWSAVPSPTTRTVLTGYDHLLVVAAHPDDECLGAGAFIADAAAMGVDVTVLVLTDGEASHPHSPSVTREAMGQRRSAEADRAAIALAPAASVVHAQLPDGALADRGTDVVAAVRDLVRPGTFVIAPWIADGHPDHDAAGRGAAAAVAASRQEDSDVAPVGLGHYLVWFWHWGDPDALPWTEVVAVDATLEALDRREGALRQHHSQHAPLSSAPGDEALLTQAVLAPFGRGFTTLILRGHDLVGDRDLTTGERLGTRRAATFDDMFEGGDDPWSSRLWYERRKRALTLAVLRKERYDRVLDLGCSTGVLTQDLASRAGQVVAVDVSKRALDVAQRVSTSAVISWVQGEVPAVLDVIDGRFDLIVVSELGYFLRPLELWLTLAAILERLTPGGELVLVHWRHPTANIPLDGPTVHEQVRSVLGPWSAITHVEDDVLVDGYEVPR